ncbi:MAG: DUF6259 domain-containing protein [Clostridium sp.]|nr:DUF6259 domain-containing protein [Clostridium sp.]
MEDLSYSFPTPHFCLGGFEFSLMVYTFRNVYAPKAENMEIQREGDTLFVRCKGLLWAGGQMEAPGSVTVKAWVCGQGIRVEAFAVMEGSSEDIRSIKVTIHGLSKGQIVNLINARPKPIPKEGLILKYPEGWRDVGTPLVIMENEEDKLLYFRSLDNLVRDKWFAFVPAEQGINAELIFEEMAVRTTNRIQTPVWEIGYGESLESICEPHRLHIEQSYGLVPWETRPDVPDWARDISLVASIHCQHWTGYIFNDYYQVLENLKKICAQVEGRRVLAYLPGWEGRYYWKYGNYTPDERMGGEEGFRKLCEGAKELGVHIMPMFGINLAGTHFDGYEEWGFPSEFRGPAGSVYGGSVDWDGSRHYDHNSNRNLNPAAPRWQNRLYIQVTNLMEKYGFDAVFFDISAVWVNDPNHYLYEGVKKLMERFKQYNPDMLLAGEGWYDGLASCIPLLQCGHTKGALHWHDEAYPPMFDTYARGFGHLCLGDASRGSTGAHELGYNPIWRCPLRKGIIPTITIVDGTLDKAPEKAAQIFEDARKYEELYLK